MEQLGTLGIIWVIFIICNIIIHHSIPKSSCSNDPSSPPRHRHQLNFSEILETGDWDSFPENLSWVDFRGDWGNQKKMVYDYIKDDWNDNDHIEENENKMSFLIPWHHPLSQGCELEPLFGENASDSVQFKTSKISRPRPQGSTKKETKKLKLFSFSFFLFLGVVGWVGANTSTSCKI